MDSLNESSNASLLIKTCATADGICKPPEQPTDIRCQHRFWRNKTQSRMGIRNSEHLLLCGRRCAHFQEKRFPRIPQQHKRTQQAFEAQRGYPSEFLVGCAAQFCQPKSWLFFRPTCHFTNAFSNLTYKISIQKLNRFQICLLKVLLNLPITMSKRSQHTVYPLFIM